MVRSNLTLMLWGLFLVMACGDAGEGHVRNVSNGAQFILSSSAPTRQIATIEFTLPRGFILGNLNPNATGIDQKGRRFRPATLGVSHNGEERFRGSFEMPEDSELVLLQLNEFEVDLRDSRIRRVRPARQK
jgi:hypothetical protein